MPFAVSSNVSTRSQGPLVIELRTLRSVHHAAFIGRQTLRFFPASPRFSGWNVAQGPSKIAVRKSKRDRYTETKACITNEYQHHYFVGILSSTMPTGTLNHGWLLTGRDNGPKLLSGHCGSAERKRSWEVGFRLLGIKLSIGDQVCHPPE